MNTQGTLAIPPCPALLADRFNTLRFDREQQAVVLLDRRAYPFRTAYITLSLIHI